MYVLQRAKYLVLLHFTLSNNSFLFVEEKNT